MVCFSLNKCFLQIETKLLWGENMPSLYLNLVMQEWRNYFECRTIVSQTVRDWSNSLLACGKAIVPIVKTANSQTAMFLSSLCCTWRPNFAYYRRKTLISRHWKEKARKALTKHEENRTFETSGIVCEHNGEFGQQTPPKNNTKEQRSGWESVSSPEKEVPNPKLLLLKDPEPKTQTKEETLPPLNINFFGWLDNSLKRNQGEGSSIVNIQYKCQ